jgi:hypothetical protein
MRVRSTGAARVEVRDGRDCAVGAILMFDVDDAFAFDIDETVELEILLDGETSDGLVYCYDRATRRPISTEVRISKREPRFQSVVLSLERARLANRLLAASEFGLAARGAQPLSANPADTQKLRFVASALSARGEVRCRAARREPSTSRCVTAQAGPSIPRESAFMTRMAVCRDPTHRRRHLGAGGMR